MNNTVVIAGAGPAGLMLACELGLAGVDVVVADRLPEPTGRSPGMAINAAVVELLTQRGLMDSLRGDGLEWPQAHFAQLWLDPARLREQHAYTFLIPQAQLERRMEEHAVKLGADIRRGHEVISFHQDESAVTAVLRSEAGDHAIRCRYLIGCDGADSTVRCLARIGFPGSEPPFHGITGDLDANDELLQYLGAHEYPAGLLSVAPVGPGVLRVCLAEFDGETSDRGAPVTAGELGATIGRMAGRELSTGEPRWLARWANATRLADRYRAGRVFIAGDAAHVCFPLGGQALSTGMEDAVNLGWKLAADIHGWAPGGLLDTYQGERRPVAARACLTTRAQLALLHPVERIAPLREIFAELIKLADVNEYLVRMVGGLDVRYPAECQGPDDRSGASSLLGRRLPGVPLRTAAGATDVARTLYQGRGVLLDLSAETSHVAGIAGWSDRIDIVSAEPTPAIQASALLLRPDGRVAWADGPAGADDAGLRAALRAWFGEPSGDERLAAL